MNARRSLTSLKLSKLGKMSPVEYIKSYFPSVAHYVSVAILLFLLSVYYPDTGFYCYSYTANLILYILLATLTYHAFKHKYYYEKVDIAHKAVLITGCDSGFGHRLAQRLDSKGFHVFASCLFPDGEGAKEIRQKCSDRMNVLYMDVTKDESIDKVLQFVKQNLGQNVLWAVVNNAGISKGFSVDFSSIDDIKDTIDVNALGPVRVTKTFLPLLKKSKGRIVNVISYNARAPLTDMCAYVMSKYAARGFTECLSLEMNAWGVRAISIEPEYLRTPISNPENLTKRLTIESSNIPEHILSSYGGSDYLKKLEKMFMKFDLILCRDFEFVIESMEAAITQKFPFHVYKPRRNIFAWFILYLLESIIPFELYEQGFNLVKKIIGYPMPKDVK